jgi:prepilin-type processing-associated H-X9-DG protein
MLAGKTPKISRLAKCVPEDFYLIEFRSVNKLLETSETSDLWGTHLFNQASQEARTQRVGERLRKQLAIETNPLLRPFYDHFVQGVAITGSDLYFREGSDVTLLLQFQLPELFKGRMDGFLSNALNSRADAKQMKDSYLGVAYVHVETPDREINVYSAYPAPDLHVRSNSLVGLQRVLDAIQGKKPDGESVRRLGDTAEFAYIRTLFPEGAKEEDGFIYLSDPFIRRLVGPQVKLAERRRLLCYNQLRIIGHAALLYQTEHGHPPQSLEALTKAECCPGTFNEGQLRCPQGGTYHLTKDGTAAYCSHHAVAGALRPCCESPVTTITPEEAEEYQSFRDEYNQYWRTYFDPIALRIQITPERYRLETIILPLIDNSIYTSLASMLGGTPEALDALPVPERNIFSLSLRPNKERYLDEIRPFLGEPEEPGQVTQQESRPAKPPDARGLTSSDLGCTSNLRQIALAMHAYQDAYDQLPPVAKCDKAGKPLLSWRVLVLPFLEQEGLYREFNFNEPWDSEHNKKLISRMPAVYRCPNQHLADKGKTTYVVPVGPENGKNATLFSARVDAGRSLARVPDGTSNTIMLLDVDDDHAVPWTKPDDLKFDPEEPMAALVGHHPGKMAVLFADGSVRFLKNTIDKEKLKALFTFNGGEIVELTPSDGIIPPPPAPARYPGAAETRMQRRSEIIPWVGLGAEQVAALKVYELLSRGIGSQVGMHVYDASPTFDFNLPAFLGEMAGLGNRGWRGQGTEVLAISFLVASLNAPVYISVPVQDAKIVDQFLDKLDTLLQSKVKGTTRGFIGPGGPGLNVDFYECRVGNTKERAFRGCTIGIGPIKWRIFWARVGNGLYIASEPFILEDLLMGKTMPRASAANGDTAAGPTAHAMVRIRPGNWHQVLPEFQLGWAENNRQACINNLGPLSSVARAFTGGAAKADQGERGKLADRIRRRADDLYDVHCFCPEGGMYVPSADGKSMECTMHGSMKSAHQGLIPAESSALGRLLQNFAGMTASLTFLEDGLHAVVDIERK